MGHSAAHADPVRLDKKRTVVLLRSVVVISTSYLILFGPAAPDALSIGYISGLIVSDVVLCLTPKHWFHDLRFSAVLLLGDTAAVLVGLYLTVGCFSQDFLIIYFFTIFLTTATQGVAQIALGAAMVSGIYGYWLWISSAHVLGAGEWLRLPFFFIVAVFYAYMTEETKQERWRRQRAERESERLRFLLALGNVPVRDAVDPEWVNQIGGVVEAAFPRLRCTICADPFGANAAGGAWFPLRARQASLGGLRVTADDGVPLSRDEEQFCRVVALVAANMLDAAQRGNRADESVRLKQEFLGTLSHELRTPLHAILGYTEMLDSLLESTRMPQANDAVDRLRANACRLQDLLGEMLWFAELRAGNRAVQADMVDLRDLVAPFEATMREQLAGRLIRFECEIAADVPPLRTDRRKLVQIVSSLLSNAAKFTETGLIRLSARCAPGRDVEITVRDSGIGIDPKDADLIFQEFRQLDASLTRRAGGLGLGLALAQELVAILGGRIEVESRPRCGATFRVRLPLDGVAPAAAAEELQPLSAGLCNVVA